MVLAARAGCSSWPSGAGPAASQEAASSLEAGPSALRHRPSLGAAGPSLRRAPPPSLQGAGPLVSPFPSPLLFPSCTRDRKTGQWNSPTKATISSGESPVRLSKKAGTGTGTPTFGDGCGDRGHCGGSGMKGRRGFLRRGGVASRVCSPLPCDAGGVASFSSPDP